jgi:hypothetical protein
MDWKIELGNNINLNLLLSLLGNVFLQQVVPSDGDARQAAFLFYGIFIKYMHIMTQTTMTQM